jgi:hypothetical protein
MYQDDVFSDAGSQFGLGNTTESLFFSPSKPWNGIIWGIGSVLYLPTNTDSLLGPDQWGAGRRSIFRSPSSSNSGSCRSAFLLVCDIGLLLQMTLAPDGWGARWHHVFAAEAG